MRLAPAITAAARRLAAAGVPSPRADAEWLAAHVLGVTRGALRASVWLDRELDDAGALAQRYDLAIAERARRVPLQHITGTAPFRGLELAVGPGVFIPRPETEQVAEAAIRAARARPAPVLAVDLCSGSGAIAAALAAEAPGVRVVAVEKSPEACAWAERNLAGTGVRLVQGDVAGALPELDGQVDVVVSNPPYIPPGAVPLDPEVRDHDPADALYGGGPDGLAIPGIVLETAARLAKPGGALVLEHGECQGEALVRLARAGGAWTALETLPDLAGRPRMLTARRA
ncbi:MAG: peptide chain release factor N(5)-glutamine methyltransferase [Bifidobacteriaceae bacterium]|nr:peptide chain release factor N(5)-glutamine methyltransferase [Bifidobacteriaceae bacterium]